MGRPWKELEAEGVTRCCVSFSRRKNGKYIGSRRCRHRAVEGSTWCAKHKPMMDDISARTVAVIRAEADGSAYTDQQED